MVRVAWDAPGTREYHTGIDRGMIYVGGTEAAVWSGLVAITENPIGGDAQPFYLEGRKLRNNPTGEFYSAALEAVYPPAEFATCAGKRQLSPGLFAMNQPRDWFHFSYRTRIGNDFTGVSDYKLHLVYNVIAQSSDFTYTTVNAAPNAVTHSWTLFTTPTMPKGYRPTSHFIFDTRYADGFAIDRVEAMLYGDDNSDPHMPTIDEVISLLTGVFDVRWWNLTGLPDFPFEANVGDMGVDFSNDEMYADQLPDNNAYWWNITGGDFPPEARVGDWGIDTATGEVWQFNG